MSLTRVARIAFATVGLLVSYLPMAAAQPAAAADQPLSAGELEALVAPIALYPDPLVAKVLIASTYPLEVVEADRWAVANASLKGSAVDSALANQTWDENVKSLAHTPTVLRMMSERLDWTQKLGDAFLAQEKGVTDAVQRLRHKAKDHGTLKTTPQQTVTVENEAQGGGEAQGSGQTIIIEPSEPDTVYVPYYDTQTVYGGWGYPSYPPYYWPPPYGYGYGLAAGLGFLAGAAIAGGWWNCGVGWGGGGVYINHNNFNNFNRNNINRINHNNVRNGQRWNHNASHRKGVGYGNSGLRQKYGRDSGRGAGARQDFRGRNDANRVANNLGGNRNGVSDNSRLGNSRANSGVGNNNRGNNTIGNNNRGNNLGNTSRGGNYGNRGGGLDRSSYGSRGRGGGYDGVGRGSSTRQFSSRGSSSMRSSGGGGMRRRCAAAVDAAAADAAVADGGDRRTTMAKINKFAAACALMIAMGAGIAAATGEGQPGFRNAATGLRCARRRCPGK